MAAEVKIKVAADAKRAVSEVDKLHGSLSKFKSNAIKAGAAAAVGGIVAVGVAAKQGISDAIAYEQAQKKATAALKVNGGAAGQTLASLKARAASIETLTGATQDENEVIAAQSTLLRAGLKGKKAFGDATLAAANIAAASNTSVVASSKLLSKALLDPATAAGKLRRSNIQLTDSQQKQIAKFVESGQKAKAQAVILGAVNKQLAGQAKAAGQGAGASWAIVKDTFQDTARDLAAGLLPAMSRAANYVRANLPAAIETGRAALERIKSVAPSFDTVKASASALFAVLRNPAFQAAAAAVLAYVAAFRTIQKIQSAIAAIKAARAAVLALNVAFAANPVGIVVAAVAALVVGLVVLYKRSQTARQIMTTAFSAVGKVVLTLATLALKGYKLMFDGAVTAASKIVGAFAKIPGPIGAPFRKVKGFLDDVKAKGDKVFDAAIAKTQGWKSSLDKLPKKVALQGEISDAQKKIKDLQAQKKDATKAQKVKINADIAAAQARLRTLKAQYDALRDKTIHVKIAGAQSASQAALEQHFGKQSVSGAGVQAYTAQGGVAGSAFGLGFAKQAETVLQQTTGDFVADGLSGLSRAVKEALGFSVPSMQSGLEGIADGVGERMDKASDSIKDNKAKISDWRKEVEEMRKSDGKVTSAEAAKIAKIRASIAATQKQNLALDGQRTRLDGLKVSIDRTAVALGQQQLALDGVNAQLATAQDQLASAKQAYSDFASSVSDSFARLADLSSIPLIDKIIGTDADGNNVTQQVQTAENIVQTLADRAAQAVRFTQELNSLQQAGLAADYVKQLAAQGPEAALATVDALAAATPQQIAAINASQAQILRLGQQFGDQLAKDYFQNGVDTAQGIVNGLLSQQAAIENAMRQLAEAANKAYKDALKIKSPSRVMALNGFYTANPIVTSIYGQVAEAKKASRELASAAASGFDKPLSAAAEFSGSTSAGSGGGVIQLQVIVKADPLADKEAVGRAVVDAVDAYVSANGPHRVQRVMSGGTSR